MTDNFYLMEFREIIYMMMTTMTMTMMMMMMMMIITMMMMTMMMTMIMTMSMSMTTTTKTMTTTMTMMMMMIVMKKTVQAKRDAENNRYSDGPAQGQTGRHDRPTCSMYTSVSQPFQTRGPSLNFFIIQWFSCCHLVLVYRFTC